MSRRSLESWRGRIAALAIAALALVPVVLSGHSHERDGTGTSSSSSCSVCVTTVHSPAALTAAVIVASVTIRVIALLQAVQASAPHAVPVQPDGRAPPQRFSSTIR